MHSHCQVILEFILFTVAKKHKLAIDRYKFASAQACVFLHASANKIN